MKNAAAAAAVPAATVALVLRLMNVARLVLVSNPSRPAPVLSVKKHALLFPRQEKPREERKRATALILRLFSLLSLNTHPSLISRFSFAVVVVVVVVVVAVVFVSPVAMKLKTEWNRLAR